MKSILSEEIKNMFLLMNRMENGNYNSKSTLFEDGPTTGQALTTGQANSSKKGGHYFNCEMTKSLSNKGEEIVHFVFKNIPAGLDAKISDICNHVKYSPENKGSKILIQRPQIVKSSSGEPLRVFSVSTPLKFEGGDEDSVIDNLMAGFDAYLGIQSTSNNQSTEVTSNAEEIVNNIYVPIASYLCQEIKSLYPDANVEGVKKMTIDKPTNSKDSKGIYKNDLIDRIERSHVDEFSSSEKMKNDLNLDHEALIKALSDGFNNGKWTGLLTGEFPTIDILGRIYGKMLTLRNKRRVNGRYLRYSSNKNLPNPTAVYSRSTWIRDFHCQPKRRPKMAYPLEVPKVGHASVEQQEKNLADMRQTTDRRRNSGTISAAANRNYDNLNPDFTNAWGYDITDVEPIDEMGEKILASVLNKEGHEYPQILSNISGGINNRAIADNDEYMKGMRTELDDEQKKLIASADNIEAKATLFNKALKGEKINTTEELEDVVEGSGKEGVAAYLRNIRRVAEGYCRGSLNLSNSKFYGPWLDVITYAIAGFTIGRNELQPPTNVTELSQDSRRYNYVLSAIESIYNAMSKNVDGLIQINNVARYDSGDNSETQQQVVSAVSESIRKDFFRFI